ncbi:riboflavin synthase alpha chain [Colwellia chukchiensis]|uniref:Riboflavin synthase n=1 Tax=Colwellia chukchiensis TaxID=641665 RepID=A0A1H7QEB0_9GAMM|nr:riboflavin synthase subunit alpha [Colwellia chukchiensis]SEL46430.1 riboflavin synthase alpha chain [Colwellia chukchiensis]
MFTGIVQSQAEVIAIISKNNAISLRLALDKSLIAHLEIGASVAVNGVCLTAVEFGALSAEQAFIEFDVIDETLRVTNLANIDLGSLVNVERSLKIGDEIGGHMLSGHVHTQAVLKQRVDKQDNCMLSFTVDPQYQKYLFAKGFIAINGVSLTLGADVANGFAVHLIPETLARTNLQTLLVGDSVNIEFDQQTMTIVNTIERMQLTRN